MRIALPLADGKLAMHFGHCEHFALIDVEEETKKIVGKEELVPPPHEPGVLPMWLAANKANIIIAGGMGMRARDLFERSGIKVCVGAKPESPERLVSAYLEGTLQLGDNICDH
jgi:ATP-binding protein involved in chromosome partitioning